MKEKHIFVLILLLYGVGLIAMSIIPVSNAIPTINKFDKTLHFAEFLFFTIILLKTLTLYKVKHPYFFTGIISLILIVPSEFIQILLPFRHFSYADIAADVGGIFSALIIKWKL